MTVKMDFHVICLQKKQVFVPRSILEDSQVLIGGKVPAFRIRKDLVWSVTGS